MINGKQTSSTGYKANLAGNISGLMVTAAINGEVQRTCKLGEINI